MPLLMEVKVAIDKSGTERSLTLTLTRGDKHLSLTMQAALDFIASCLAMGQGKGRSG